MDKKEIFEVAFSYQDQSYIAEIRTDLPLGPEPFNATYEVWMDNKYQFSISPHLVEQDTPSWALADAPKNKEVEPAYVEAVGEAIERAMMM